MATTTRLTLKVGTTKDLVGNDLLKLVKTINKYLGLVEVTGIGERIGVTSISVRLSDTDPLV